MERRGDLFAVTFDETYCRACGMKVDRFQFLLSLMTSVAVVMGMRVLGAMMISSFIIFPALTARRLSRSFKGMISGFDDLKTQVSNYAARCAEKLRQQGDCL